MATINQMITRLKSVDMDTAIPALIQQTSYEIIALNQQQLYGGSDSDSKKIHPSYRSKSYAKKKFGFNPSPGIGTPDLFLTGALYQGMGVVINDKDKFTIQSTAEYFSKLEKYYQDNGSTVFKLSPESKGKYANGVFFEGLKKYIGDKTQLL